MFESLQSVITQDAALSCLLASYQDWIDKNGDTASLNEISVQLDNAQAKVSEYVNILWVRIDRIL